MAKASVPKYPGIYEIVNTLDGKRYIGSAQNIAKRWGGHRHGLAHGKHKNPKLAAAWAKHGPDAFVFRVIYACRIEDLIQFEQRFIDELRPEYNIRKIAESNAGLTKSAEHRAKLSAALMGHRNNAGIPKTAEHRANLSKAKKGVPNLKLRGKKHSAHRKRSAEEIAKAAASLKITWARRKAAGLVRNEEAIAKQAASLRATLARKRALRDETSDDLNVEVVCACGCGSTLPRFDSHHRPRRFVSGHNLRVQTRSAETMAKIAEAIRIRNISPDMRMRVAASKRGKPLSEEHKAAVRAGWVRRKATLSEK